MSSERELVVSQPPIARNSFSDVPRTARARFSSVRLSSLPADLWEARVSGQIVASTNDLPDGSLYTQGGQEAVMDKTQMQKERGRLQAVLDGYASDTHPGLVARIAHLDRRIAQAHDA